VKQAMKQSSSSRIRGFSLIELMVSIVIGMIAILVVMQVFALSESSRRTTTGSDDAQNAGSIAMVLLQRDMKQAGYGLSSATTAGAAPRLLGCTLTVPAPANWSISSLAPVTINHPSIPAGDTNTDTLLIIYGSSNGSPDGDLVNVQPAQGTYTVSTPTSFQVSDRLIAAVQPRPVNCTLTMESAATVTVPPDPPQVTVPIGVPNMSNGALFNLGQSPRVLVYAVRDGNLTVCDGMVNNCGDLSKVANQAVWVPVADNVVSLRAQYGRDTTAPDMDGVVDDYAGAPAANTACGWVRVSAVRYALVTRSGQYEKVAVTGVTAPAPTWAGSAAKPLDLSLRPQWQNYRYRTFETTIPMRNIAWQGKVVGC
jgi:type IV pilus assembly protein PilW